VRCRVVVTASAAEQIDDNDAWWHVHRLRAPKLFRAELERAFALLKFAPEIGPLFRQGRRPATRRLALPKSKRWVYYCYDPRRRIVTILAVWGTQRGVDPPGL